MDVHYSSSQQDWLSPPEAYEPLSKLGGVGLDPSANASNNVGADIFLTVDSPNGGGLGLWPRCKLAYSNPTYSSSEDEPRYKGIKDWVESYRANYQARRFDELVALIPARTDTRAFHAAIDSCSAVFFWKGRMVFHDPATGQPRLDKHGRPMPAPFPSALLYWGSRIKLFGQVYSEVNDGALWLVRRDRYVAAGVSVLTPDQTLIAAPRDVVA